MDELVEIEHKKYSTICQSCHDELVECSCCQQLFVESDTVEVEENTYCESCNEKLEELFKGDDK
jgi:acetone carboxylase gamma subunit